MHTDAALDNDFIQNLVSLSTLVEEHSNLDSSLNELSELVAKTLKTANCSIMLLKEHSPGGTLHLRVQAHHGYLSTDAYNEKLPLSQSIAGKVAETGQPLLVEDICSTTLPAANKRSKLVPGGFISFPIMLEKRVLGVVNINTPLDNRTFNEADLELANILSLFIAKSIQMVHLQNLLKSQYAMAALAKEQSEKNSRLGNFTLDHEKVAKILARSFFNDMKRIGLGNDHILEATTEIIDLLGKTISKHDDLR